MNWKWLCAAGASGVASFCLFHASAQQVPKATPYTAELIRATGGRQVFEMGPAPSAGLVSTIAGLLAIGSIGSLIKGLDWQSVGDFEHEEFPGAPPAPQYVPPLDESAAPTHSFMPSPVARNSVQPSIKLQLPEEDSMNVAEQGCLDFGDLQPVSMAGFLCLIGGMGSGKSTLAAAIVRDRLMRGHRVVILNHHYAFGDYKPLKVYGKGDTLKSQFADISRGLYWFLEEREARYKTRQIKPQNEWDFVDKPITILIEELGEYKGNVDPDLMQTVMKTIAAGTRKANIFVVLVSQHDTMEMLGGSSGLSHILKTMGCFIKLRSKPDPSRIGGLGPTGYAGVSISGGQDKEAKVPDFSTLFPDGKVDFSDLFVDEPDPVPVVSDEREFLNQIYNLPAQSPAYEQDLPMQLKAILDYARKLGSPITSRIVQQQKLRGTEGMNADDFRNAFNELAVRGLGQVGGDGAAKWFLAN